MVRTKRDLAVRCGVLLVSLVACGIGTALYVNAALGNDPLTAFIQGLSVQLGYSYGAAMNIVNIVAIALVLIMDKHFIHLGTVLSLLLGGFVSNFCIDTLSALLGPSPQLGVRIILLLGGTVSIGFGVGFYQAARLGTSPLDALNQIIAAKLKMPLRRERMLCDALFLVCALMLGGLVSAGTVVSLLLTGPIMAAVLMKFSNTVDCWAGGNRSRRRGHLKHTDS